MINVMVNLRATKFCALFIKFAILTPLLAMEIKFTPMYRPMLVAYLRRYLQNAESPCAGSAFKLVVPPGRFVVNSQTHCSCQQIVSVQWLLAVQNAGMLCVEQPVEKLVSIHLKEVFELVAFRSLASWYCRQAVSDSP
jgi:hypothetical protein